MLVGIRNALCAALVFTFLTVSAEPCRAAAIGQTRGGVVLALSGGGTKGIAHIGVLKVLEREGIPVAGIVGTSIGSVIGGLYACGYSADEIYRLIHETNIMSLLADSGTRVKIDAGDHRPAGENPRLLRVNLDRQLQVTGPLGVLPAHALVSFLTEYTGNLQTTDFDDLLIPFACVATDLETGEEVVLREGNLASAIRASVSIPGLLEPWPIGGRLLIDGGLVTNLPVIVAKEIFPGYPVIAVNLAGESISKSRDRLTSIIDVIMQTIDIMTVDRVKANEAEADLLIHPELGEFGMLDATGYEEIFRSGFEAADAYTERIVALSEASQGPPPAENIPAASMRVVRNIRVEGLHDGLAVDLEARFAQWIGSPYDVAAVNSERDRMTNLDNVASVNVETYFPDDDPTVVDLLFSVEKRPVFEFSAEGYTTSFHEDRWIDLRFNARDLLGTGDSANVNVRVGNNEWGGYLRYFTPMMRGRQWGFALTALRDDYDIYDFDPYDVTRFSARILHYWDWPGLSRIGLGLAAEHATAPGHDKFTWGPYLYYDHDTLDNLLTPSRGYSINARFWLNDTALLSRTTFTAYVPFAANLRFLLNLGLETGKRDNSAHRAILGDTEELISLSRRSFAGDQVLWGRIGLGRDYYSSWWGAVRGEAFAAYGMALEEWTLDRDIWEAGLALLLPGQFLNGRVALIYNSLNDLILGFSLGFPNWSIAPLP